MLKSLILCIPVVLFACGACAAEKLSYVDLVKRLTDLERLSVLPPVGENCAQASSYDRASVYDEKTGKYVGWDANGDGDGGGQLPKEGDLVVMADIQGPGCIWRTWSAAPGDGRVKIYLDGASQPTVDLPFRGYFDLKNPPFNYPALVHTVASGTNNYVPIPFQKSCKILAEKKWGNYFHFTYTTYPKGTVLPTFKMQLAPDELAALAAADKVLGSGLGVDPAGKRKGESSHTSKVSLIPGSSASSSIDEPGAITAIRVKGITDPEALRAVALRITWDDDKTPSVWCPLGDFFGTGPGANKYKSLPMGMTKDGFYSFWYMPFSKKALVELVNEGKTDVSLDMEITSVPISAKTKNLGRFHAKWHRDMFLPKEPERWIDWPMLITQGRGRFCGVTLNVYNPKGGWWGEGDEKFWVDGEKFPSTFGTGSEDYFGYAWCNPELFQHAYHNQTLNKNGNRGNISVNRWHISDNVPFQTAFEADIEKYEPNDKPTLYSCTAYWYLSPGGTDNYPALPMDQRVVYQDPEPYRVKGAIEGETMKVLGKTGGETDVQYLGAHTAQWSEANHLLWIGGRPGDKLDLALPVVFDGSYELIVRPTISRDYAIVQFYLDGAKAGEPIDLYIDELMTLDELSLGKFDLKPGEHKLTVEIIGANEKAYKAYLFGLDYVKLTPAK